MSLHEEEELPPLKDTRELERKKNMKNEISKNPNLYSELDVDQKDPKFIKEAIKPNNDGKYSVKDDDGMDIEEENHEIEIEEQKKRFVQSNPEDFEQFEENSPGIIGKTRVCLPLYNVLCLTLQFILIVVVGIILIVLALSISSRIGSVGSCETKFNSPEEDDNTLLNSIYELTSIIASSLGIYLSPPVAPPTLIVQITIDQLRSDMMLKYRKRFIPNGGFDRLMKNGVLYRNAHYRYSRTVTPVGHATLVTDRELGRVVSSIENGNYRETDGVEDIEKTAPTYLESTTFGDELLIFSNESKVFSVSMKDVPAVICAGHLGKAFWFSPQSGNVISSTYFYEEYPDYVRNWNEKKMTDSYLTKYWELEYPEEEYHFQNEYIHPALGKEFPKPYYQADRSDFINGLIYSPAGDEITWDFMKSVIVEENLGKRTDPNRENGAIIDYLSLSFSTLDTISHICGTDSIESEDALYKEDRMVSNVLDFLDEHIGLQNCLIALSSDHGGDLSWGRIVGEIGFDYERIFPFENIEALEDHINKTVFGGDLNESVILDWVSFQVFLRTDLIRSLGKSSVEEVQTAAAQWIMENKKEVLFAFTKHDLMRGWVPDTELGKSVMNNFHPQRSGDVIIIVKEYGRLASEENSFYIERHGTTWNYDQHIPIIFMGQDIPKGFVVDRRVSPEDVAPTLSAYFGFNPPSGNTGDNLVEVLRNHDVNPFEN